MNTQIERRRSYRQPIVRAAKVYDPKGDRYLAGLTLNISSGGALLTVRGGADLPQGAAVEVAVAASDDQPLIRRSQMIRASVARSEGRYAGSTVIALAYADRAALRPAA